MRSEHCVKSLAHDRLFSYFKLKFGTPGVLCFASVSAASSLKQTNDTFSCSRFYAQYRLALTNSNSTYLPEYESQRILTIYQFRLHSIQEKLFTDAINVFSMMRCVFFTMFCFRSENVFRDRKR